jgi:glycosyltransferase involved in cell wall biosynthesis
VRRTVTTLACISQAQAHAMAANGFADVRTSVVYNGLDAASCVSRPDDGVAFRRRLGLDDRPIVLFGGRASGAKGGNQIVRAMAVATRRVAAQLVVLGDRPEYFNVVRQIVDEVGLPAGVVHNGGWLDAEGLREAHGAAAVCAIPSVYPDPFNLMTLRAMLHGRPVVGTCHGATPELVVDGVTGRIADPWDAEAFGAAIAVVVADPVRGAAMGAAGRERGAAMFTLARQLDGYARLLGVPTGSVSPPN